MNRISFLRLAIVGSLGVFVWALAWRHRPDAQEQATFPEVQVQTRPVVQVPQTSPSRPTVEEVRRKAQERVRPHLDAAERRANRGIVEHLGGLDRFFQEAKKGTPGFAGEALGFRSKWRMVVDYLPFADGDGHQKLLSDKFQEHVFGPEQMEAAIQQAVKGYLDHLQGIENRMLVDIRADLSDLPPVLAVSAMDRPKLEAAFREAIRRARERVGADLKTDIGTELVSIIAGEVLAQVAVRLGVSAGVLGTGAASGWATFGIGLVVGVIVDQIISWVWDWWADPKGELAGQLDDKLDELRNLIVEGDGRHPGLRRQLEMLARSRGTLRRQAVADLIQSNKGGAQ